MKKILIMFFSLCLILEPIHAEKAILLNSEMVAGDTVSYNFSYTLDRSNPSDVNLSINPSDNILDDVTSISIYEDDKLIYSSSTLEAEDIELQDYSPNEKRNYRIDLLIDRDADNRYTQLKNEMDLEFTITEHQNIKTGVHNYQWQLLTGILLSSICVMIICYKKRESRKSK